MSKPQTQPPLAPAPKLHVVPDPNVAPEVLAQAIIDISIGMKKLNASRLNRDGLILLLHDSSGVGKPAIRKVLAALDDLEKRYLRPKAKP
jgi:hypothetical protein